MTIDLHAVVAGLLTWGSAAKIFAGGIVHKIWSALVGAEKKAKAEIEKLIAEAQAEIKKL